MKKPKRNVPDSRDLLTIRADDMRDDRRFVGQALAILLDANFAVRILHVGREEGVFSGDKTLLRLEAVLGKHTVETDGKAEISIFGALRDVLTTSHGATIQLPGIYADHPFIFCEADGEFWIDMGAQKEPPFPEELRRSILAKYRLGDEQPYIPATDFWNAFRLVAALLADIDDRGKKPDGQRVEELRRMTSVGVSSNGRDNHETVRTMTEIALRIPDRIPLRGLVTVGSGAIVAYEARCDGGPAVEWGVQKNTDSQAPCGYILAKDGGSEGRTARLAFSTGPWRFVHWDAPNGKTGSRRFRRLLRRLATVGRKAAKRPARRGLKDAAIDAFMEFLR